MRSFPIIENNGTFNQFIDCWSRFYNYQDNDKYLLIIKKHSFSEEDIRELFIWKNGMPLSRLKSYSLETKIIPKISFINQQKKKKNISLRTVSDHFSDVSAVWSIFIAHLINPHEFPIFDQHVYRAMKYLQTDKIIELTLSDAEKIDKYENEYLVFYRSFFGKEIDYKKFDESMWVFGKFLKQLS